MRYIERVTEDSLLNKRVRGRKLKYTDNKAKKHFKCDSIERIELEKIQEQIW